MPIFLLAFSLQIPAGQAAPPDLPDIPRGPKAHGRAALERLGDRLPEVARAHGKTAEELKAVFERDPMLWVGEQGTVHYVCETHGLHAMDVEASGSGGGSHDVIPPEQTFFLHSRPGASKVIYLDFNGHVTSGTHWNNNYNGGKSFTTPPYDTDGNAASFSATELANIQHIWQCVAEDYSPFDVDVTTEDPGVEALRKTSSGDNYYGMRVCIGGSGSDWYGKSVGGTASLGSFNRNTDTPCYVFPTALGNGNKKYVSDAVTHEVGHTLGLYHDGLSGGSSYYTGHGDWAPIMGVAYYVNIGHWSKGEYPNADNQQDDLAVMQNYGLVYRPDDHANWMASATVLSGSSVMASGVIEKASDVDMFTFQSGDGSVEFTVFGPSPSPSLDVRLGLYNGNGHLIAYADSAGLDSTLTANVSSGTYYLSVEGVGMGSASTGYTDYGSIGEFILVGTLSSSGGTTQVPVASASGSPTTGPAPLTVNLSSAGSYDPDGSIASYDWELGDGNTSAFPNPSNVYSEPGTYQALLIVTDDDGLSSSDTVTITVTTPTANAAPVAVAYADTVSGVAPLSVNFFGGSSYDSDGTIADFDWVLGDGNTSTRPNPPHVFESPGVYEVVLTVTDNDGAKSSDTLTVTVTSSTANAAPVAVASADTMSGPAPLSVNFRGADSFDADGFIADYGWDLGDGNTSTRLNPSHRFELPGVYEVVLSVTDDDGATSSDRLTITVTSSTANQAPVAVASASTQSGYAPLAVSFSGAGSSDADGSIVSYAWTFGDGGSSTAVNPSHTFQVSGTYTVQLTVTDDAGATDSDTVNITVLESPNQAPVAVVSASTQSGYAPLVVSFTGAGSLDADGSIVSYAWTFGDGTSSTAVNPSHTFAEPGSYNVRLTVTDDDGATGSATLAVQVESDGTAVVYVQSIAINLISRGKNTAAEAVVIIVDDEGAPRANAVVSGRWDGMVSGNVSAVTDGNGRAVFTSDNVKQSGIFEFIVTDVGLSGYEYDPSLNVETSESQDSHAPGLGN